MAEEKGKKPDFAELSKKLSDGEIDIIMAERARRLHEKVREEFMKMVAICNQCGAPLTQQEYNRFEGTGCPRCGGGACTRINFEATAK